MEDLSRQLDALAKYKYDKLIKEKYTGTQKDREGLNKLLEIAREGDTIIVESISRLGRRTIDILTLIDYFNVHDIKFISIKENIDSNTPTGKAMLSMLAVIAQLERDLIAQRVQEGLESAKKRGKQLGRPKVDKDKINNALRLYDSGDWSIKDIVSTTGVSQGTLYRHINNRKSQ